VNLDKIKSTISKFNKINVLVVGDLGIDTYIVGEVKRISPEAPVPVLRVKETYSRLGLALNVANNVSSLNANSQVIGLLGEDTHAKNIKKLLKDLKISDSGLIFDNNFSTINKTRVLASNRHHLLRLDFEEKFILNNDLINKIIDKYSLLLNKASIVIIQDYGKGLINKVVSNELISMAKQKNKAIFVDPSRNQDILIYKNADLIKPNLDEFKTMNNLDLDETYEYDAYAFKFIKELNTKYLVLTKGIDGMSVYYDINKVHNIASNKVEVFDVSGAGDTVIASLALAYTAGLDIKEAAYFANICGAIVVTKVGTSTLSQTDIFEFMKHKNL